MKTKRITFAGALGHPLAARLDRPEGPVRAASRSTFMCRDIRLWLASSRAIGSQTRCSHPPQIRARAARRVGSHMALNISSKPE
jgi:hypothetical protein